MEDFTPVPRRSSRARLAPDVRYQVLSAWSESEAGPERPTTATGFPLLAGNLGGALLVLAVQLVVGNPYLALGAFAVLAVPGVVVASRLPAHAGRHRDVEASPDASR